MVHCCHVNVKLLSQGEARVGYINIYIIKTLRIQTAHATIWLDN